MRHFSSGGIGVNAAGRATLFTQFGLVGARRRDAIDRNSAAVSTVVSGRTSEVGVLVQASDVAVVDSLEQCVVIALFATAFQCPAKDYLVIRAIVAKDVTALATMVLSLEDAELRLASSAFRHIRIAFPRAGLVKLVVLLLIIPRRLGLVYHRPQVIAEILDVCSITLHHVSVRQVNKRTFSNKGREELSNFQRRNLDRGAYVRTEGKEGHTSKTNPNYLNHLQEGTSICPQVLKWGFEGFVSCRNSRTIILAASSHFGAILATVRWLEKWTIQRNQALAICSNPDCLQNLQSVFYYTLTLIVCKICCLFFSRII